MTVMRRDDADGDHDGAATPPRPTQVMTYPIALHRPNEVVWVWVIAPVDLTEREAERIARMVMTLGLPPGAG